MLQEHLHHSGEWGLETTQCQCLPQLWQVLSACQNWPKKKSKSTPLCSGVYYKFLGADKTFTTHWSSCRVQVWAPIQLARLQAPTCHLAIAPKGYSRSQSKVLAANQWLSRASAQLGPVRLASSKTGQFPISCCCCWPQPAWGGRAATLAILT